MTISIDNLEPLRNFRRRQILRWTTLRAREPLAAADMVLLLNHGWPDSVDITATRKVAETNLYCVLTQDSKYHHPEIEK
jgi:hypothetical protein